MYTYNYVMLYNVYIHIRMINAESVNCLSAFQSLQFEYLSESVGIFSSNLIIKTI